LLVRRGDFEYRGWVEDLDGVLQNCRIGLCLMRYGAGMKGKVGEYLSNGLPCVMTNMGAEGMGFINGIDALIEENSDGIAKQMLQLYNDEKLWEGVSIRGYHKIDNWSFENVRKLIGRIV